MYQLIVTWANSGVQDTVTSPSYFTLSMIRSHLRLTNARVRIWDCKQRRFC